MSIENPLDEKIERVIVSELQRHRFEKDLTKDDDCAVIAKGIRVRLQRAGVLADVKRTPERVTRDDNDEPLGLDPYSPQ